MKKIIAIILSIVTCLFVTAGCGATSSDYEYIVDKGEIVVGITDYAPMDYKDKDGNWIGFDADFARAVSEKMGVEVKFVEIDWDNKFIELKSKSIDCIWNGMTISTEVENNTNCSKAYAKNNQVVVMPADKADKYKDVEDLSKLSFAVESGSAGQTAAEDNGLEYTAVTAQSNALMEVQAGSVDACIIDKTMAEAMTGKGTSYSDLTSCVVLTDEEYGVGFRKDSDMTEKFNSYMDELKKDGVLDTLAEKYKVTLAE
ncbi:MAG: transporter substrate-binding domain-containing protein [Acutalibacteraceae bacterium]